MVFIFLYPLLALLLGLLRPALGPARVLCGLSITGASAFSITGRKARSSRAQTRRVQYRRGRLSRRRTKSSEDGRWKPSFVEALTYTPPKRCAPPTNGNSFTAATDGDVKTEKEVIESLQSLVHDYILLRVLVLSAEAGSVDQEVAGMLARRGLSLAAYDEYMRREVEQGRGLLNPGSWGGMLEMSPAQLETELKQALGEVRKLLGVSMVSDDAMRSVLHMKGFYAGRGKNSFLTNEQRRAKTDARIQDVLTRVFMIEVSPATEAAGVRSREQNAETQELARASETEAACRRVCEQTFGCVAYVWQMEKRTLTRSVPFASSPASTPTSALHLGNSISDDVTTTKQCFGIRAKPDKEFQRELGARLLSSSASSGSRPSSFITEGASISRDRHAASRENLPKQATHHIESAEVVPKESSSHDVAVDTTTIGASSGGLGDPASRNAALTRAKTPTALEVQLLESSAARVTTAHAGADSEGCIPSISTKTSPDGGGRPTTKTETVYTKRCFQICARAYAQQGQSGQAANNQWILCDGSDTGFDYKVVGSSSSVREQREDSSLLQQSKSSDDGHDEIVPVGDGDAAAKANADPFPPGGVVPGRTMPGSTTSTPSSAASQMLQVDRARQHAGIKWTRPVPVACKKRFSLRHVLHAMTRSLTLRSHFRRKTATASGTLAADDLAGAVTAAALDQHDGKLSFAEVLLNVQRDVAERSGSEDGLLRKFRVPDVAPLSPEQLQPNVEVDDEVRAPAKKVTAAGASPTLKKLFEAGVQAGVLKHTARQPHEYNVTDPSTGEKKTHWAWIPTPIRLGKALQLRMNDVVDYDYKAFHACDCGKSEAEEESEENDRGGTDSTSGNHVQQEQEEEWYAAESTRLAQAIRRARQKEAALVGILQEAARNPAPPANPADSPGGNSRRLSRRSSVTAPGVGGLGVTVAIPPPPGLTLDRSKEDKDGSLGLKSVWCC